MLSVTDLLSRALRVIPSGCSTFSKSRGQWPANAPSHLGRGSGAHVWDERQNEYIDFTLGLGPIILGYQDPHVERSVQLALGDGPIFSMPYQLEVAIAEMLTEIIPCAEMVKFGLSGSDATSAAIRCARAYTGREWIVSQGYHGWHDWCCPNRSGIPDADKVIRIDDWREARCAENGIAAIIVEPEYADDLPGLRKHCTENGIVLIFDEVLTGFRVALGGFQEYSGITPDLATLSKAMGNGYPVSAAVGKREIMQTFKKIGYSGTFFGSTLGLAAAGAVIRKMRTEPVIERLWKHGTTLRAAFNDASEEFGVAATLGGLAPRMTFHFPLDTEQDPIIRDWPARLAWRTLFAQELIARGVLANFGLTVCYAHSEYDIKRACEAIREAFKVLASVDDPSERLVGDAAGFGVRPT